MIISFVFLYIVVLYWLVCWIGYIKIWNFFDYVVMLFLFSVVGVVDFLDEDYYFGMKIEEVC